MSTKAFESQSLSSKILNFKLSKVKWEPIIYAIRHKFIISRHNTWNLSEIIISNLKIRKRTRQNSVKYTKTLTILTKFLILNLTFLLSKEYNMTMTSFSKNKNINNYMLSRRSYRETIIRFSRVNSLFHLS